MRHRQVLPQSKGSSRCWLCGSIIQHSYLKAGPGKKKSAVCVHIITFTFSIALHMYFLHTSRRPTMSAYKLVSVSLLIYIIRYASLTLISFSDREDAIYNSWSWLNESIFCAVAHELPLIFSRANRLQHSLSNSNLSTVAQPVRKEDRGLGLYVQHIVFHYSNRKVS